MITVSACVGERLQEHVGRSSPVLASNGHSASPLDAVMSRGQALRSEDPTRRQSEPSGVVQRERSHDWFGTTRAASHRPSLRRAGGASGSNGMFGRQDKVFMRPVLA